MNGLIIAIIVFVIIGIVADIADRILSIVEKRIETSDNEVDILQLNSRVSALENKSNKLEDELWIRF